MFSRIETLFEIFGININDNLEKAVLVEDTVRDLALKRKRQELKDLFCNFIK
jgi:hypothetical protein